MPFTGRPIFVLGSPRSGTTVMRSILDAHPNVCCLPWETGLFVNLGPILNGHVLKHLEKPSPGFTLTRPGLVGWARHSVLDLVERVAGQSGKPRWAEKTPAHVHHMDLIHEVFPDAQFIHMIRNGYDVVKSLQNMPWAPQRIGWSTHAWVSSVAAGRAAARKLPAGQYLEIRYEQLIADPAAVLRPMCDFLGEPFAPAMLEFHNPDKNSWKASAQPLQNKPVNDHPGLGWWQRLRFGWRANRLMRELGYR
jgi:hypothetical protein